MRVLVAMNLCRELEEETYYATDITRKLASPGFNSGTRYLFDNLAPTSVKLVEYVCANYFNFPEGRSVFEYTFKKQLRKHIGTDPARPRDMMDYMAGRREDTIRSVDVFPAGTKLDPLSEEKNAVLLVNFGGNQGQDLKLFKQTYPQSRGRLILLDLPAVIGSLSISIDGVEFLPYDIFTLKVIQGAQVNFFRAICDDWFDEVCRTILSNPVKAMTPGYSKMLINDHIWLNTGTTLHPTLMNIIMMSLVQA